MPPDNSSGEWPLGVGQDPSRTFGRLGSEKRWLQCHLSPRGLLTDQAVGGHTTTKQLRIHKECTGYPQTIHIRQERHDKRPVSNDRFEGESSCSATASTGHWCKQTRQALMNRCRFHQSTHFCERISHVASTASFSPSFEPLTDRPPTSSQHSSNVLWLPALLFQLPSSFPSFFSPIGFRWCSHTS